jgi:hypothetical protein
MPHQRLIWDVAYELDPDTGLFAYDQVVVIGPRQGSGKTESLFAPMTHRCRAFDDELARWSREQFGHDVPAPGAQRVLYTAQRADDARLKWRDVHHARLQKSPYRRDYTARLQQNQETFFWRNGSTWSPASTTGKTGGTGDTVDWWAIDEAWSRPDFRTELGLSPATLTRWWQQGWVTSMIPGRSRAAPTSWPYLKHKLDVGVAQVQAGVTRGTAFFLFAAPDGADPADPRTWYAAMPGLGTTVPEAAVRSAFNKMDLVDFCAEFLSWPPTEPAPQWKLIRRATWEGLLDRGSRIAGVRAFAAEFAEDRSAACIGVAGRRADGRWHVEVVEPGLRIPPGTAGVDWVEPRLAELVKDWKPCTTVVDPARPAASLIVPLRNRGIDVTTPTLREVAGACGRFFDATGEAATPERPQVSWVHHLGQRELDRSVAGVVPIDVGAGAFVFVERGSPAELIHVNSAVLAMHGVDVKGSTVIPRSKVW